jgi:hypothetical protein
MLFRGFEKLLLPPAPQLMRHPNGTSLLRAPSGALAGAPACCCSPAGYTSCSPYYWRAGGIVDPTVPSVYVTMPAWSSEAALGICNLGGHTCDPSYGAGTWQCDWSDPGSSYDHPNFPWCFAGGGGAGPFPYLSVNCNPDYPSTTIIWRVLFFLNNYARTVDQNSAIWEKHWDGVSPLVYSGTHTLNYVGSGFSTDWCQPPPTVTLFAPLT